MQRTPLLIKTIAVSWAKRAPLACALLLGGAGVASADSFTYTYTGSPFNLSGCLQPGNVCAPFAPGNGPLTISFTIPTALAPNLGTFGGGAISTVFYDMTSNVATTPTSFSSNDGLKTLSSPGSGFSNTFEVVTNASGKIVQWNIVVTQVPPSSPLDTFTMSTQNWPNQVEDGSNTQHFFIGPSGSFNSLTVFYNRGAAGTWTQPATTIPEPSSLLLLGTGLITAAGLRRRRAR